MKVFFLFLLYALSFNFILTQRPQNIRIFKVEREEGKYFYEYTVFKNEIFSFNLVD